MNTNITLAWLAREILQQGQRRVERFNYAVRVSVPSGGWAEVESASERPTLGCVLQEVDPVGGVLAADVQDVEDRCTEMLRQGLLERQPVIVWNV